MRRDRYSICAGRGSGGRLGGTACSPAPSRTGRSDWRGIRSAPPVMAHTSCRECRSARNADSWCSGQTRAAGPLHQATSMMSIRREIVRRRPTRNHLRDRPGTATVRPPAAARQLEDDWNVVTSIMGRHPSCGQSRLPPLAGKHAGLAHPLPRWSPSLPRYEPPRRFRRLSAVSAAQLR